MCTLVQSCCRFAPSHPVSNQYCHFAHKRFASTFLSLKLGCCLCWSPCWCLYLITWPRWMSNSKLWVYLWGKVLQWVPPVAQDIGLCSGGKEPSAVNCSSILYHLHQFVQAFMSFIRNTLVFFQEPAYALKQFSAGLKGPWTSEAVLAHHWNGCCCVRLRFPGWEGTHRH